MRFAIESNCMYSNLSSPPIKDVAGCEVVTVYVADETAQRNEIYKESLRFDGWHAGSYGMHNA